MADRPKKAPRDEHLGDTRNVVRGLLWLLVPFTGLGFLAALVSTTLSSILLFTAAFAWAIFALYLLFNRIIIESAGSFVGRILLPDGSSTPPAKALSHLETMAIRGDLGKACGVSSPGLRVRQAALALCNRHHRRLELVGDVLRGATSGGYNVHDGPP